MRPCQTRSNLVRGRIQAQYSVLLPLPLVNGLNVKAGGLAGEVMSCSLAKAKILNVKEAAGDSSNESAASSR